MFSTDAMAAGVAEARILVVDDEPGVRESLLRYLEFEGYRVTTASNGLEALEHLDPGSGRRHPDLILLDVTMPRLDGLSAARRMRAAGHTVPILMITARDTLRDRVAGLDNGADDYLVKPFSTDELLARIRALLRRSSSGPYAAGAREPVAQAGLLTFEDLTMEPRTRGVTRAGRPLDLTKTEYELLKLFMSHPRRVLTRAVILREVWGFTFEPASNSLDVCVMHLRRKTEAGGLLRLIHTERGMGYVLRGSRPRGARGNLGNRGD